MAKMSNNNTRSDDNHSNSMINFIKKYGVSTSRNCDPACWSGGEPDTSCDGACFCANTNLDMPNSPNYDANHGIASSAYWGQACFSPMLGLYPHGPMHDGFMNGSMHPLFSFGASCCDSMTWHNKVCFPGASENEAPKTCEVLEQSGLPPTGTKMDCSGNMCGYDIAGCSGDPTQWQGNQSCINHWEVFGCTWDGMDYALENGGFNDADTWCQTGCVGNQAIAPCNSDAKYFQNATYPYANKAQELLDGNYESHQWYDAFMGAGYLGEGTRLCMKYAQASKSCTTMSASQCNVSSFCNWSTDLGDCILGNETALIESCLNYVIGVQNDLNLQANHCYDTCRDDGSCTYPRKQTAQAWGAEAKCVSPATWTETDGYGYESDAAGLCTCEMSDGNYCSSSEDCWGYCGGSAEVDCHDECGGQGVLDLCAVCDGSCNGGDEGSGACNDGATDCEGNCTAHAGIGCDEQCNSKKVNDECGKCGGDCFEGSGSDCKVCGCVDMAEGACDCHGRVLDCCGICGGDNTSCDGACGICNAAPCPCGNGGTNCECGTYNPASDVSMETQCAGHWVDEDQDGVHDWADECVGEVYNCNGASECGVGGCNNDDCVAISVKNPCSQYKDSLYGFPMCGTATNCEGSDGCTPADCSGACPGDSGYPRSVDYYGVCGGTGCLSYEDTGFQLQGTDLNFVTPSFEIYNEAMIKGSVTHGNLTNDNPLGEWRIKCRSYCSNNQLYQERYRKYKCIACDANANPGCQGNWVDTTANPQYDGCQWGSSHNCTANGGDPCIEGYGGSCPWDWEGDDPGAGDQPEPPDHPGGSPGGSDSYRAGGRLSSRTSGIRRKAISRIRTKSFLTGGKVTDSSRGSKVHGYIKSSASYFVKVAMNEFGYGNRMSPQLKRLWLSTGSSNKRSKARLNTIRKWKSGETRAKARISGNIPTRTRPVFNETKNIECPKGYTKTADGKCTLM